MIRTNNFTANSLARARQAAHERAAVLERLGWRETAHALPQPPLELREQDRAFAFPTPAGTMASQGPFASWERSLDGPVAQGLEVVCHGCAATEQQPEVFAHGEFGR